MYETFFGLASSPFSMTPDPSVLYWTVAHREALAGLTYAVMRRKGFVVLTGPAGTGKTTLLRKLLGSVTEEVRASFIYNPTLTPSEFLELTLTDFNIPSVPMNKAQNLLRLEQFLLSTHREGRVAVLVIDEAHKLSPEVLEEIRLLTNFENAKQKLLQIVLAGQPDLNGVLDREDLWQLKQRIAVRLRIQPLSEPEVQQYMKLRWTKAGGPEPLPFSQPAIGLIATRSQGIPRVINGICDNALLLAFGAGRTTIGHEDILEVIRDLGLRSATAAQLGRQNGVHAPSAPSAGQTPAAPSNGHLPVAPSNGHNGHNGAVSHPAAPSSSAMGQIPFRTMERNEAEQVGLLGRWAEKFGLRARRPGVAK